MADPSCLPQYAWMNNQEGQGPCTVAGWLLGTCVTPGIIAGIPPDTNETPYLPPNKSSATVCSCSWAFYNAIQACQVCQGVSAEGWVPWSSICDSSNLSSPSYWPSKVSFSQNTTLPRWAIVNPLSWDQETFNATQAQDIAKENFADVTNSSASQPSVPSISSSATPLVNSTSSTPVGAIIGGVVGGVLGIGILALVILFYIRYRHRQWFGHRQETRQDIDLTDIEEKPLESPRTETSFNNPFAYHQSMSPVSMSTLSPQSQNLPLGAFFPGPPGVQRMSVQSDGSLENYIEPYREALTINSRTPRRSSLAEQMEEKRRRRGTRQSSLSQSVTSPTSPLAHMGQYTTNGPNGSNVSHSITHSITHSRTHSHSHSHSHSQGSSVSLTPSSELHGSADDHNSRPARRLSLRKAPWYRRRSAVNEAASSEGDDAVSERSERVLPSTPLGSVSPTTPRTTVPGTSVTGTMEDLIAAIPGARLPSAREREMPPPMYSPPSMPSVAQLSAVNEIAEHGD